MYGEGKGCLQDASKQKEYKLKAENILETLRKSDSTT